MKMVNLIQQKYGESCQMRSPLTKKQCDKAHKFLPDDLFEVLKISNGINEVMINPNTNKVEVMGRIIYSLAEMKTQTDCYLGEYGSEGVVFAGNGAGGFFVLKPDGRVFLYKYYDLGEEFFADSLWEYFNNL